LSTDGQNHQVGFEDDVLAQEGVGGIDQDIAAIAQADFGDLGLGEHNPGIALHLFVEQLRLPRSPDVLIQDHGRGIGVLLPHIDGLL
jgi:hypothetical protein